MSSEATGTSFSVFRQTIFLASAFPLITYRALLLFSKKCTFNYIMITLSVQRFVFCYKISVKNMKILVADV